VALVALAVVACGTAVGADPTPTAPAAAVASAPAQAAAGVSASPSPSPTASPAPLLPASPGADPASLFGWLFTPIFQGLFLLLAGLYALTGNIVVSIVLMTVLIRLVTIRLSARQIVSQKRMQILAPELRELTKELQRRYKGEPSGHPAGHTGVLQGTGRQPHSRMPAVAAARWPALPDVLGHPRRPDELRPQRHDARLRDRPGALDPLPSPDHIVNGVVDKALPCINTVVFGINVGQPQVLFNLPLGLFTLGVSALALTAGLLQFVQSRMLMPPLRRTIRRPAPSGR